MSRDPRSKYYSTLTAQTTETSTTKQIIDDQTTVAASDDKSSYGIYDYKNIYNARNRLLHDLSNVPSEILRETYFKNRERQLRKSRFEQRDINSHKDKLKDSDEVRRLLEVEKKDSLNKSSLHLWDLESERELKDKENGYFRGKRSLNEEFNGVPKLTHIGNVKKNFYQ